MDPQSCLAQLARLLSDEARLLASLESQLQHEHELLRTDDMDGLEAASGARQQSITNLLRLDDERRALCRAKGYPADQAGLAALLAWCDPNGTLAGQHSHCAGQAQKCRAQNDRNGALVTARLRRVSGMLDMLTVNNTPRTYQPGALGASRTSLPAGRMVSISA